MSEEPLYLGVFYKKERPTLDELVASKRKLAGDSFSLEKLMNSFRS